MQLTSLVKKLDEIEKSNKKSIFESIGQGDQYFITWEREIHPILCEVALQPDQINQLFKDIESSAGRTGLGKAVDAVKGAKDKISDVWFNKFGGMLQNSTPVQAFDQKWEQIKSSIAAKHPDLAAKLAKYGEFAKNNPNLHKFLLAIGGSAAAALGVAVAGGVGAGALAVGTGAGIATGILNIADRLLQGQKASTAIGRGATTGAIAGLAAGAAAKIGEMIRAGISSDVIADLRGLQINKHTMEYNGQMFSAVTKEPETSMLKNAWRSMTKDFSPTPETIQKFADVMAKVSSPEYQEQIGKTREIIIAAKEAAKSSISVVKDLTAIAASATGGAASATTAQRPTTESLTRNQINELFGFTGNKVDASKLEKAWKAAGSPTDSDAIARILQSAGVEQSIISSAFTKLNIPVNANTGSRIDPTLDVNTGTQQTQTQTPPVQKLTVAQINKIIPTLKLRELKSLQKIVDDTLSKRTSTVTP